MGSIRFLRESLIFFVRLALWYPRILWGILHKRFKRRGAENVYVTGFGIGAIHLSLTFFFYSPNLSLLFWSVWFALYLALGYLIRLKGVKYGILH